MNSDDHINKFEQYLDKYWELIFADSYYSDNWTLSFEDWMGFVGKDDNGDEYMIVGKPKADESNIWYFDGPHLGTHKDYLGIDSKEYTESMKNYLNKKFDLNPEIEMVL